MIADSIRRQMIADATARSVEDLALAVAMCALAVAIVLLAHMR